MSTLQEEVAILCHSPNATQSPVHTDENEVAGYYDHQILDGQPGGDELVKLYKIKDL
ncbi:MAG: hypothetical protein INQ03_20585 [Candidatus Heimdallarchaeota archaeon]|nr:hypothetical protein [Candidatus Heimdallarchaeota archaeon]